MHRFCIKTNNAITNDPCAVCGGRCDPTGLDLFLDGTEMLVCDSCGWEFEPELMRALVLSAQCVELKQDGLGSGWI